MSAVALTLFILWVLSLWMLLSVRQRFRRAWHSRSIVYLGLISGAILFVVLSLSTFVLLRLLLVH